MREFLIVRRDEGESWFDLTPSNFAQILHPTSFSWQQVDGWGSFRILVNGCEIYFSDEMVGIQMVVECDSMPEEQAQQIADEVLQNIGQVLGQTGEVIQTQ